MNEAVKPNVLFLMSDEHRFDVSGFAGNKIVRTPVLDFLADGAAVFDNAYTPSPVCIPARQCLAAGQYPRHCRVEEYGEDLPSGYPTFAKWFGEEGYVTAAAGKLHHMGTDQMQGWRIRLAGDTQVGECYYREQKEYKIKREGGGIRGKWDEKKEILRAGPGFSAYARRDCLTIQAAKNFIYEQFVDSFYDRADPGEPVFLYVGLMNPHYPYIARQDLFDYYLNRVEPYRNKQIFQHSFLGNCPNGSALEIGKNLSERDVCRAMAAYYANIETIDKQFGEVIKTLEKAGQNLDDWVIIYCSDHGEMLGEHSLWEKQKFFEGSVRVPLFLRYRGIEARRIKRNVSLVDIYPTLCRLCDIKLPDNLDGTDLLKEVSKPREIYSQWLDHVMVKLGSIKYQRYGDGSEVLFDLNVDPDENRNLINETRYYKKLIILRDKVNQYWKSKK